MSVPVNKRAVSKLEFMEQYYKIYDCVMYFIMKDFGIKRVVRDNVVFSDGAKMLPGDKKEFDRICGTYNINYESNYPLWVLEEYRKELFSALHSLLQNITTANSIYPNSEYEYNLRRQYMSLSISNCEYLLQCFQRVISILPVNQEKYVSVVEMIMREIDLLRAWKKSSNKFKKNIIMQEELNRQKIIESMNNKNNVIDINNKATIPITFNKSLIKVI